MERLLDEAGPRKEALLAEVALQKKGIAEGAILKYLEFHNSKDQPALEAERPPSNPILQALSSKTPFGVILRDNHLEELFKGEFRDRTDAFLDYIYDPDVLTDLVTSVVSEGSFPLLISFCAACCSMMVVMV